MVVAMFHVEVAPGHEDEFLERFRQRARLVERMLGFQGFELLRDRETPNRFIVMTRWDRYEDFVAWMESEQFQKAHARLEPWILQTRLVLYERVE